MGAGYVVPPSVEYSNFTFAIDPVRDQVMFLLSPTFQVSPPTGDVRLSLPLMKKSASEASVTSPFEVSVTRTRT